MLLYEEIDVPRPVKQIVPPPEAPAPVEETVATVAVEPEPVIPPPIPDGQEGWVTVALAVIGIAGGGALWKFLTKRADQNHEVELKKVELAQAQAQTCAVCEQAHKLLDARIDVLGSKLDQFSANISTGGLDDLDERLTSLERALKKRTK